MNGAGTLLTLLSKRRLQFKTFQFHVLWNVHGRSFFSAKPIIEEKDYQNLLENIKPYRILWIQTYFKRETPPGSLCYLMLQKNSCGTHVNPDFGDLKSKEGVLYYKEVQKKMPDKIFEGDNFDFVYPYPRPEINIEDTLNLNLKASNSSRRPRTADFLFTLGIETI